MPVGGGTTGGTGGINPNKPKKGKGDPNPKPKPPPLPGGGGTGGGGGGGGGGGAANAASLAELIAKYTGWNAQQAHIAIAIAMAESGINPNAQNSIGATGIWQILLRAHPDVSEACARDPICSTKAAYRIWQAAGNSFSPWTTFTGGAYKKYLGAGAGAIQVGGSHGITFGGGGSSGPAPYHAPNAPGSIGSGKDLNEQQREDLLVRDGESLYLKLWGQYAPPGYVRGLIGQGMNMNEIELHERSKPAFSTTQTYHDEARSMDELLHAVTGADMNAGKRLLKEAFGGKKDQGQGKGEHGGSGGQGQPAQAQ